MLLTLAGTCGALLVLLPFLPWYAADLPGGTVRVSGVGASGELWIVPPLGVLAVSGALLAVRFRRSLAVALTIAVAGGLAAGWALRNAAVIPVRAVVEQAGGTVVVEAQVTLEPAAPLAVVAGALTALAGGLMALRVWMTP